MKAIKTITTVSLFVLSACAYAAGNTNATNITSIELREGSHHAIYVSGTVPDQGCDLSDRAILIESGGSGQAMLANAMLSIASEKTVNIRVDGCTEISPGQGFTTAPKVVKMQIYSQ